ncbi:MAG: hypothetical protein P8M06_02695 [Pelagibacterales bacterium]|nr:hypothetical protein [Pelagibacterales bacterium]
MALESNLQADKITPSGLRKLTGLLILILTIIFIFLILNNIFKKEEFEPIVEDVITEEENVEDYDDFIFALPSGKLNFYDSKDGYELSINEYETICKNTKIITQRSIMGANISDIQAQELYNDNGNKIDRYLVKWDDDNKICLAEYTIKALQGSTETVTVIGQAKGFLNTGVDTRVYFIKNF